MAYQIAITSEAKSQLGALPAREQRLIEAAVQAHLLQQPTTASKAIKKLRPNRLVEFELRVGDLRILYNIEGAEVVVLIVGRKVGNKLIVKGQEFDDHKDDPTKPA